MELFFNLINKFLFNSSFVNPNVLLTISYTIDTNKTYNFIYFECSAFICVFFYIYYLANGVLHTLLLLNVGSI